MQGADTWLVTRLLTLSGKMMTNQGAIVLYKGTRISQSHPSSPSHYTISILEVFGNPNFFSQMVLKLYTSAMATCGRRVAVILHEKNVPYELIEPNWAAKEHKSEAWTKNQPFGQMPYIDVSTGILHQFVDVSSLLTPTGRTMDSSSSKAALSLATSRPSTHPLGHLFSQGTPAMSKLWRFSTRLQASSCAISSPRQVASPKRRFSISM